MKTILLILCCILTLISCARTVDTADEDLFIELTINLNNTAASDSTITPIYTIILSPTENIQPSNPTKDDYYIFPGKSYAQETLDINNKTINSYYADNFSTWEQFIYISNNQATRTSFDSDSNSTTYFESTTTDNQTYIEDTSFNDFTLSQSTTQINIAINITELNLNENDTTYLNILTFKNEASYESGYIQDYLGDSTLITLKQYSAASFTLDEIDDSNDPTDIISWSYTIY